VRCSGQTCSADALELRFELDRRVTGFRAAKPERHHAVAERRDRPIGNYLSLFDRSLRPGSGRAEIGRADPAPQRLRAVDEQGVMKVSPALVRTS
jgi:hypothetical protein